MSIKLEPCPFCGEIPRVTKFEWLDECHYFGGKIVCCVDMPIEMGWMRARDMTTEEKVAELEKKIEMNWNAPLRARRLTSS